MAATTAAKNKKIRQEALREQLANKGLVQHVIDIANKLSDQHLELESSHIQALRASADIRMKLINKYLPDLKAIEHSNDPESPMGMTAEQLDQKIKALMNELESQD